MLYYDLDVTLLKWENYKKQIRNGGHMTRIKDRVEAEAKWQLICMEWQWGDIFVVIESFCVLTVQC